MTRVIRVILLTLRARWYIIAHALVVASCRRESAVMEAGRSYQGCGARSPGRRLCLAATNHVQSPPSAEAAYVTGRRFWSRRAVAHGGSSLFGRVVFRDRRRRLQPGSPGEG